MEIIDAIEEIDKAGLSQRLNLHDIMILAELLTKVYAQACDDTIHAVR